VEHQVSQQPRPAVLPPGSMAGAAITFSALEQTSALAARKLVEIANASEGAGWPHRLSATFFLACLAAMQLEGVVLEEI
jgi:hypothetical protein